MFKSDWIDVLMASQSRVKIEVDRSCVETTPVSKVLEVDAVLFHKTTVSFALNDHSASNVVFLQEVSYSAQEALYGILIFAVANSHIIMCEKLCNAKITDVL